ncbi:MAG: twin-arginine translocase TatA/TatE family subunit [Bacteroidales bacterium]|nr:twin-arginine translocase TatA/TatE family subunit [Bacteroidales bacterium]
MYYLPLLLGLGTPELILIALAILLLFGATKIPEIMKGIGKGIKSFKKEMNSTDDEAPSEKKEKDSDKQ